jgi:hypothetical protein
VRYVFQNAEIARHSASARARRSSRPAATIIISASTSGRVPGAGRRDGKATGLAWFSLEIEKPDLFAAQEERLRKAGSEIVTVTNGIEVSDLWGTRVRLIRL